MSVPLNNVTWKLNSARCNVQAAADDLRDLLGADHRPYMSSVDVDRVRVAIEQLDTMMHRIPEATP